jgi:cbb3-type cytochrome oxidase subunit 3
MVTHISVVTLRRNALFNSLVSMFPSFKVSDTRPPQFERSRADLAAMHPAMNASFFLLILSLLFLGYMTRWNKHVLFLMLISTGLWMTMIWYVYRPTKRDLGVFSRSEPIVCFLTGSCRSSQEYNFRNKTRHRTSRQSLTLL